MKILSIILTLTFFLPLPIFSPEPEKQFALVERHIDRLRTHPMLCDSPVVIMVERNLGFEAEHHHRALQGLRLTRHRVDHTAQRYGILTTEEIKHAMCTLLDNMLREQRLSILPEIYSERPTENTARLREQLHIYSLQFKQAANNFGKTRVALNGKVGGMKDDVAIALQLAIYYSASEKMYA